MASKELTLKEELALYGLKAERVEKYGLFYGMRVVDKDGNQIHNTPYMSADAAADYIDQLRKKEATSEND